MGQSTGGFRLIQPSWLGGVFVNCKHPPDVPSRQGRWPVGDRTVFSPLLRESRWLFARVGPREKGKNAFQVGCRKTKYKFLTMSNTLTFRLPYPLRHLTTEIKSRGGRFDAESKTWSFLDNARRSGGNRP